MSNVFLISDMHIRHKLMTITRGFSKSTKREEVTPEEVEAHDHFLRDNHNKIVNPEDTVYDLGDTLVGREWKPEDDAFMKSFNGKFKSIGGNHCSKGKILAKQRIGWELINGCYEHQGDFVLSHMPVHPTEMEASRFGGPPRFKANIHGHFHEHVVMRQDYNDDGVILGDEIDPRYLCVSMEQINLMPISWEEVKKKLRDRGII